jgi:hypothetical protein
MHTRYTGSDQPEITEFDAPEPLFGDFRQCASQRIKATRRRSRETGVDAELDADELDVPGVFALLLGAATTTP